MITLVVLGGRSAGADPGPLDIGAPPPPAELSKPSEPSSTANRQLARRLFAMALELVHDGRYAAAKALFLEAYATEPHYLVLYNIAQAELRLDERDLALQHLREFLNRGGDAIDPRQRKAAEDDIERVESDLRTSSTSEQPQANASRQKQAAVTSPAAPEASRPFLVASPPPSSRSPAVDPLAPPAWTYGVIAGGFAVVGAAVGLYVWNDARYDAWRREDAGLRALETDLASNGVVPTEDPRLVAGAAHNDARLESVERFDPVPLVLGGIGVATMAVGLWALIDIRDTGSWSLLAGPSGAKVRASF